MKAAILFETNKPLEIHNIELEPLRETEVLVKMVAAGVCHSDHHAMVGDFPARTPIILGHEGSGIIEEVGPNVKSLKKGDHVVSVWRYSCGSCEPCMSGRPATCGEGAKMRADGTLSDGTTRFKLNNEKIHHHLGVSTFSSHSIVSEKSVLKIRKDMPLDKAALVSCGVITGFGAVKNAAKVQPGESVAVFGAGGVGLNAIQGAAIMGADPIIAIDLFQNKLEFAKIFGATHTVNSSDENPEERILEITNGHGVHYAFEMIGVPQVMSTAFKSLRIGGTAVVSGLAHFEAEVAIPAVPLVVQEKKLIGALYGSVNPRLEVPRLIDLYLAGKLNLDDLLTRSYPLEEINDAYDALIKGEVARSIVTFE
ncbi:MAG: Zn-dependent alcohol dehydrogenase [Nitrospinota bacterium]|nr:Zn-dependent alcohol dehydrogenase [Nitrospinota bacterium]